MSSLHTVAVAQWHIQELSIEQNHAKACDFIEQAASQNAELVVLPEYHLNGWAPSEKAWNDQASTYQRYIEKYQCLARKLRICLVPGSIVERHPIEGQNNDLLDSDNQGILFNTTYFISYTGDILGHYRKKNIWHPERPFLTSSGLEPHVAFETPLGKFGLLLCWDLAFPEAFRELISQGCEIVIIPTYWALNDTSSAILRLNSQAERLFVESALTTRCFENTCAVVFANACGPSGQSFGGSSVILPLVGPLGRMDHQEGVMVVEMT